MAALIAWMLVVRVGNLVKDRRPPKAAALRAVLDKIANTNNPASKRSRPHSDAVEAFAIIALLCHNRALPVARLIKGCRGGGDVLTHTRSFMSIFGGRSARASRH